MPYAIRVSEDNIDIINAIARQNEFDLSYIIDNFYYNAADGFGTVVITDGTAADRNVTYTEMTDAGFAESWKFAEPEDPKRFVKIERV